MSKPLLSVGALRGIEGFTKTQLFIPAPTVAQLEPTEFRREMPQYLPEHRFESTEIQIPLTMHLLAGIDEFPAPTAQFFVGHFNTTKQTIALSECPLKALPLAMEPMFHVEHAPIQELSAIGGRPDQKIERIGIDHL